MNQEIQRQSETPIRQVESPEQLFLNAKEANRQAIEMTKQQFSEKELGEACLAVYQKLKTPEDKRACLELGETLGLLVDISKLHLTQVAEYSPHLSDYPIDMKEVDTTPTINEPFIT